MERMCGGIVGSEAVSTKPVMLKAEGYGMLYEEKVILLATAACSG